MLDVMIDLETLGTKPGSVILSLGAVEFDPVEGTMGREFYEVIDTTSCVQAGLLTDPGTVQWWEKQSLEARKVLELAAYGPNNGLGAVAHMFNTFLQNEGGRIGSGSARDVRLWGNGSDFDNVLLIAAFEAVDVRPAWRYFNHRCYRTLKNLFPVNLPRTGAHNALADAKYQAAGAIEIFKQLRGKDLA